MAESETKSEQPLSREDIQRLVAESVAAALRATPLASGGTGGQVLATPDPSVAGPSGALAGQSTLPTGERGPQA